MMNAVIYAAMAAMMIAGMAALFNPRGARERISRLRAWFPARRP